MDLNFNWFKQDPIDLEHKQYVLLNYLKSQRRFREFSIVSYVPTNIVTFSEFNQYFRK